MNASRRPSNFDKFSHEVRLAFQEYLTTPTIIIVAFLVLAIAMIALEQSDISWLDRLRGSIESITFGEASSTQTTLGAAAGALITITSITFTVLLIAIQQAAGAMSPVITDQFLRRPFNQVVFGYFVGMSLYSLIVLASTHSTFDPVLSALLAFVFSGIALYLLAALVYVTLTQMRPPVVIHATHDGVLEARKRQLPIVEQTRRAPQMSAGTRVPVQSRADGYVNNIDLRTIKRAIGDKRDELEIVLHVQVGSYVALHDEVAEIRVGPGTDTEEVSQAILQALQLGRARDLQYDPAHGIRAIMNIGWTSISTSKQDPVPGTEAIQALRSLLAHWVGEEEDGLPDHEKLPVVYDDDILWQPLRALESLAVVATESMQHQNFALVLRTFGRMFDRLPAPQRSQLEEMIPRILSRLQYEVLTTDLDEALLELADALAIAGSSEVAEIVWEARQEARNAIPGLADADGSA